MLKPSHTQPLERHRIYSGDFATEPYECALATEAIFFIRIESVKGEKPELRAQVQISPDGINWVDEGTSFEPMHDGEKAFVRVREFGGWLRLAGHVPNGAEIEVMVHLVLKG